MLVIVLLAPSAKVVVYTISWVIEERTFVDEVLSPADVPAFVELPDPTTIVVEPAASTEVMVVGELAGKLSDGDAAVVVSAAGGAVVVLAEGGDRLEVVVLTTGGGAWFEVAVSEVVGELAGGGG